MKQLLDAGALEQHEYDAEKAKLLGGDSSRRGASLPGTNATAALWLGILSWVCAGPLFSVPGWLMANAALKTVHAYGPDHPDRGIAYAARLISLINASLYLVLFVFYAMLMVVAVLDSF